MDKKEIEKLEKHLESEKERIVKELESFSTKDAELEGNWNAKFPNKEKGDLEEEANDATEYDNLISLERNMEVKLRDINSALQKIKNNENGKYGFCEKCGGAIETERINACPEAKFCINCAI